MRGVDGGFLVSPFVVPQNEKMAVQKTPVINPWNTARLDRQLRPDSLPLKLCQVIASRTMAYSFAESEPPNCRFANLLRVCAASIR